MTDQTVAGGPAGVVGAAQSAILTVDDDPAVSRAVARDLRRRYGATHRVVRAQSGAAALEALRELRLRGEQVAVILADYRMPGQNGIEFLEQAMDLYPAARRVLLTAYADTSAAIDAINVVDLDHYLLKPWDPPEEKLYPVVDALLEAWRAEDRRPVPELKVIGHQWSPRSYAVRDFLARNRVPYRWYLAGQPEGDRLLELAAAPAGRLPVVLTTQGRPLVEPTDAELAAEVGLSTSPSQDFYDLVVIGGGPAGLGAAVYGASEGLRTVLVERSGTGGQAGQSSRIENYLGFPDGVSGAQLTGRAHRQATRFGAEVLTACEAIRLEAAGSARVVHLAGGRSVSAHTVLLATGVEYNRLPGPGLGELVGRGVYYGGGMSSQAAECTGEDVLVVGAANSAGQAAVFLSRTARSVTLLARGPSLTASMSHYLIQQIAAIPSIRVRTCTEVISALGTDRLEAVTVRDDAGRVEQVPAGWLFAFIGAAPRTDWLDGALVRDDRGFVVAGPDLIVDGRPPPGWRLDRPPYHLETSLPGVFVAGDVRADSAKRVASAVGEGAMAVLLVHRYLEKL